MIRLYLRSGGRCVVTGEKLPFSKIQPDHRIPYSSAKAEAETAPAEEAEAAVPGVGEILMGITAIGGLIKGAIAEHKEKKAMEDGWEERKHAMIDLYEARVMRAEREVIRATKDFVHYLSEACIKF